MLKCIVFVGTRPEFIKLKPVIDLLRRTVPKDQVRVVFTGQHTDLLLITDSESEQYADDVLSCEYRQPGLSEAFISLQTTITGYLRNCSGTGYVLVQGDTATAAAAALASRLCGWQVMHIEAGLRTYQTEPFPEEMFRRIISNISFFHFAPTEFNARNLRNEGVREDQIMVCGNTGIDHLTAWLNHTGKKRKRSYNAQIRVLATLHRRENQGEGVQKFAKLLERITASHTSVIIDWILHPSVEKDIRSDIACPRILFHKPMSFDAFAEQLLDADLLITDSGGLQEEAVAFGVPMVVYRNCTERQEAILQGYPAIVSTDHDAIVNALDDLLSFQDATAFKHTYGDGYAAHDIVSKVVQLMNIIPEYKTVIIGGGPGGTGPLLSAVRLNMLKEFSNGGLAVIEKGNVLVRGQLASYKINSDTLANVFFECLDGENNPLREIPALMQYRELFSSYSNRHIPLDALEEYLTVLGRQLEQMITAVEGNHVYFHSEVTSMSRLPDNRWLINTLCNGTSYQLIASQVIMAPGGRPERPTRDQVFSNEKLAVWRNPGDCMEVLCSDDVLRGRENERLSAFLEENKDVEFVILGSSHSAFSVAWYLKNNFRSFQGEINIAGHEDPVIYYPTVEDAKQDGYHLFDENDICPITGRVFRLGGLRGDGRDLYRCMKGLGSDRILKVTYRNLLKETVAIGETSIARPYILIVAYGYKLNIPEVFDEKENSLRFKGKRDGHWVNEKAQLLDDSGDVVPGLYAIGLATGFLPGGELGGEPSFRKQTNGLWYYQHLLGEMLVKQMIA